VRSIKSIAAVAGLSAALVLGVTAVPASAHHSFGQYEMSKVSEIEGTVNKFEWSNPHCWLFVDVAAANGGAPVTYGFELQSVGEMLRRGWKKTSVKPGEKVKVKFRPMRDGTPAGLMASVEKDGQLVGIALGFGAPAAPPGTPPGIPPAAPPPTPR
jgi:Family of unknown function (DUF6152)